MRERKKRLTCSSTAFLLLCPGIRWSSIISNFGSPFTCLCVYNHSGMESVVSNSNVTQGKKREREKERQGPAANVQLHSPSLGNERVQSSSVRLGIYSQCPSAMPAQKQRQQSEAVGNSSVSLRSPLAVRMGGKKKPPTEHEWSCTPSCCSEGAAFEHLFRILLVFCMKKWRRSRRLCQLS